MLGGLAKWIVRFPKWFLGAAAVLFVLAAVVAAPVNSVLAAGGYQDPNSESARAQRVLLHGFDRGGQLVIIRLHSIQGADVAVDPAARAAATEILDGLSGFGFVQRPVLSLWSDPGMANALQSRDHSSGLIAASITGSDKEVETRAQVIADRFSGTRNGIDIAAGGQPLGYQQADALAKQDLVVAEGIAVAISLLVLVWVFRGLIAAAVPVAIGLSAIVGTAAWLRVIATVTDVSVFALNLATALGLALAIDYTLLLINRYREEVASGRARPDAVERAVTTAGRTVLFSAIVVALSLSILAIFPMYFLRSFAYAGLAVVVSAAVAAIAVAPAMLVLLGARIDSFNPLPWLRTRNTELEHSVWYRTTQFVQRRAVVVGIACVALLLTLGMPFLGVHLSYPDDRVLPATTSTRQVADDIRNNFAQNISASITVVVEHAGTADYGPALSAVSGVTGVIGPAGTYSGGHPVGPGNADAARPGVEYLTVLSDVEPFSRQADDQLTALHAVPQPTGARVLFTGLTQENKDNIDGIFRLLPVVLGLIALTTCVLLFLLTGSVLLPLKALVMNVLSLSATFGALVWIFQDGNLGGLGTTATGGLVANVPVLMFCVAFGLSMDYEVFLLARICEEWSGAPNDRASNDAAVARGLARTGYVVTAAAVLMAIVFTGFATAQVAIMRMLGVGLTLAVLMDATVIRMLLVPAFMRLAGRANRWAPAPLRWVHTRFGISEGDASLRDSGSR
ncbi:MMPL family transporter [Nocardia arthritidis]|uniref:MMPL family transporter n=1 Tax=Nocardia arthritidis TaxID=228602 RepID=A0A6G9YLN5_9NOCA|nr:MMPL family transporter [Nocardia arthritidis]QIS14118.1 MMPL family transporter [Nocardia arthritidis]